MQPHKFLKSSNVYLIHSRKRKGKKNMSVSLLIRNRSMVVEIKKKIKYEPAYLTGIDKVPIVDKCLVDKCPPSFSYGNLAIRIPDWIPTYSGATLHFSGRSS